MHSLRISITIGLLTVRLVHLCIYVFHNVSETMYMKQYFKHIFNQSILKAGSLKAHLSIKHFQHKCWRTKGPKCELKGVIVLLMCDFMTGPFAGVLRRRFGMGVVIMVCGLMIGMGAIAGSFSVTAPQLASSLVLLSGMVVSRPPTCSCTLGPMIRCYCMFFTHAYRKPPLLCKVFICRFF